MFFGTSMHSCFKGRFGDAYFNWKANLGEIELPRKKLFADFLFYFWLFPITFNISFPTLLDLTTISLSQHRFPPLE
jgi:hypothetical protein